MPKIGAELSAMSLRKRKRKTSADDGGDSEILSDIDDAVAHRYINSKPEMIFKKLVWEAMNKDYGKGKTQQKWVSRLKKTASDKKTARSQKEVVTEKRFSSKINYAALNNLMSEQVTENPEEQSTDSNSLIIADSQHSDKKSSPEEDNNYEEGDKFGELTPEEDNHEESDKSGESEQDDDDYNEEFDAPINYGYEDEEGGYGDWNNDCGYDEEY